MECCADDVGIFDPLNNCAKDNFSKLSNHESCKPITFICESIHFATALKTLLVGQNNGLHGRSDQDRDLDEPVHEHGIRESIYRLVLSLEAVFWHDIHTHQNEKFRNHGDEAKSERKVKSESYICFTNGALIVGCVNLGGVKANQDQV